MTFSISDSEGGHIKRHSLALASLGSRYGWPDSEDASIAENTVDADLDYPRPTRLYQCALVLAGFIATFQTIGSNQTYGIFQVSSQPSRCRNVSLNLLSGWCFWTGILHVEREQHR